VSFAASFRKAAAIDFYITKYQGKPMETLQPLFRCMTDGVMRLEKQEEEELATRMALAHEAGGEPARKQRKTTEDWVRRARRLTIRLATRANRCFWVSAAELTVHILTDGDCLQSHNHITLFTRQLQWAMDQCKKQLNNEPAEEKPDEGRLHVRTVAFHAAEDKQEEEAGQAENEEEARTLHVAGAAQPADESCRSPEHKDDEGSVSEEGTSEPELVQHGDQDVHTAVISKAEVCTTSTNAGDDFAHRGRQLHTMPFYVYRMYVRRIPKPKAPSRTVFFFDPHYPLARSYAQEVVLVNISVPTIDGFQCPTVEQDAEQNALLKAILFTPWACPDPLSCGNVLRFRGLLSNGKKRLPAGMRRACTPSDERGSFAEARSSCSLKEPTVAAWLLARSWSWRTPLSSQT